MNRKLWDEAFAPNEEHEIPFNPVPGARLTPERERVMLMSHGTTKWDLSPKVILDTAKADIERKAYNADLRRQKKTLRDEGYKEMAKGLGREKPYAFLPKHVKKAKTPEDLLYIAWQDYGPGLNAKRPETVALYHNRGLLLKAAGFE